MIIIAIVLMKITIITIIIMIAIIIVGFTLGPALTALLYPALPDWQS